MSVWLTIPSARSDAGTVRLWKQRGYRIALWRDQEDEISKQYGADGLVIVGSYPGYAKAVNALVREVLARDAEAEYCIATGDDTEPDQNYPPAEIARQCTEHFKGTFGVMQPTGDRWSDGAGVIIERIAGSPWIGREFAQRANGGVGPLWPEYTHCFVDNEIMDVAQRLGVFWQRRDLAHMHQHWARPEIKGQMPHFLAEANSVGHWNRFKALYDQRRAAGFPGHEPLPA